MESNEFPFKKKKSDESAPEKTSCWQVTFQKR